MGCKCWIVISVNSNVEFLVNEFHIKMVDWFSAILM